LITAPIFVKRPTLTMTHQTLRDVTYREAIPTSGRCTICGHIFTTPADALADPQKATWDFYKAFELHECVPHLTVS
ncbi:MAG: hypothetical protein WBF41_11065, partial [Candidatus Sulfotelmatobacter sp.]